MSNKIKEKIEQNYEYSYEISRLVEQMIAGTLKSDKCVISEFLKLMEDTTLVNSHSPEELLEVCKLYFNE